MLPSVRAECRARSSPRAAPPARGRAAAARRRTAPSCRAPAPRISPCTAGGSRPGPRTLRNITCHYSSVIDWRSR